MDWLNLHTKELDSPEVIGAEPIDRGTWLMLLRYCIGQENGGRIDACGTWKDRKWQQLVRVTLAEVKRESELWTWETNDLVVTHYPSEKEKIVQTKREIARVNGTNGGRPSKPTPEPILKPILVNSGKAEGKGREGKGIEGNGREAEEAARAAEIELIRNTYPRRTHVRETLTAIEGAVRRAGGTPEILAGVQAIATAVAGWSDSEKLQFLKLPHLFFEGDHWRDDPAYWASKSAARKEHAGVRPDVPLDLGGRKPKAVRGVPVGAAATDDNQLDF